MPSRPILTPTYSDHNSMTSNEGKPIFMLVYSKFYGKILNSDLDDAIFSAEPPSFQCARVGADLEIHEGLERRLHACAAPHRERSKI